MISTQEELDRNVLTIKTVQIAPFRTLMTALKDIFVETNISFKKDGMRIVNMDQSHTILAHLYLDAKNFELYDCKEDKIIIGVNMFHLFKLINTVDNDDTLTIFIDKDYYEDGITTHLGLKFENGDIKQCKTQKMRLIEPINEELNPPDLVYSSVINLPSTDFQKIIRDLNPLSDRLEIKTIGNELIFKCSGTFAEAELRRIESDGGMEYQSKPGENDVIQGVFSLKNLNYFIKCTNLCNQIELHLENDRPLIVKYYVASLGEIKLCLTPLPDES